jgi:cytochrome c553
MKIVTLVSTLALIVGLMPLVGVFAGEASAEPPSVFETRCASCHGADGRADTPVGRALKIRSFEGASFTREGLEKVLRESKSHVGLEAKLGEGDLEALVETLNALAAGD